MIGFYELNFTIFIVTYITVNTVTINKKRIKYRKNIAEVKKNPKKAVWC